MRKFAVLALLLALTGCSAQVPAPKVTPVSDKYCALSDASGFDDDGLNRSVYAALQQLKVQFGATVMALEVGENLTAAAGIEKLVSADCSAIITAGEALSKPALQAAKTHETIRFVSVSNIINTEDNAPNFAALTFNIYEAAFAAGYLAAATAASSSQENQRISVIDKLKTSESRKSAKAFIFGVARYNTLNRKSVSVEQVSSPRGDAITFALAGNFEQLQPWTTNSSQLPQRIIGYGRDWYSDARNTEIKPLLLTSVVRVGVIDKVVAAVTAGAGSQNFDLASGQVALISENEISFPTGFDAALEEIIKDFSSGEVKVG